MTPNTPDKKLPLDHFTAEAVLRHFEAEAAFGAVEWPKIADPTVLFAAAAPPKEKATVAAPTPVLETPVVARREPLPAPIIAEARMAPKDAPLPAPTPIVPPSTDAEALPPSPTLSVADGLKQIAREIAACTACGLAHSRTQVVPGQGNPKARLLFVGEAPGETEDATGFAFVGPAGELLTKMILAMGLKREDVFIANVLKCRPPMNRAPEPVEVQKCFHFLERQIALVNPEVICALGAHAATNLLGREETIGRLRGRTFTYGRSQLVATYHPSYLLRMPEKKKDAWADLQLVMKLLGLKPPPPAPKTAS